MYVCAGRNSLFVYSQCLANGIYCEGEKKNLTSSRLAKPFNAFNRCKTLSSVHPPLVLSSCRLSPRNRTRWNVAISRRHNHPVNRHLSPRRSYHNARALPRGLGHWMPGTNNCQTEAKSLVLDTGFHSFFPSLFLLRRQLTERALFCARTEVQPHVCVGFRLSLMQLSARGLAPQLATPDGQITR